MNKTAERQAYETRCLNEAIAHEHNVNRNPLLERKENAGELGKYMATQPELVAQRIGWLLNGSYGYGEMLLAHRSVDSRGDKVAQLTQLIAIYEWQCPATMAVAQWRKLSKKDQDTLKHAVQKEIDDYLDEVRS